MNLSRRENRYMDVARLVSRTSDYHGAHIGCVVAHKKVILSVASNSEKTHSLQGIYNTYRNFDIKDNNVVMHKLHAEICALSLIYKKNIDWKNVEVYVYREWRNGRPAISRPCPACSQFMRDLGIRTIIYNDINGNRVKEII